MKIKNDMGNRYEGSVGKQVTAATWKGRNYIKKYTKPSNPNTVNQQRVRGYFAAAVAWWKTLTADQKAAYGDKTRADKTNVSGFNTMVSSYVKILEAGNEYAEPAAGHRTVLEDVTENPIEDAIITVRKTGQSTDYQESSTDALGVVNGAICAEDERYDLIISATGYVTDVKENYTAAYIWPAAGEETHLVPV